MRLLIPISSNRLCMIAAPIAIISIYSSLSRCNLDQFLFRDMSRLSFMILTVVRQDYAHLHSAETKQRRGQSSAAVESRASGVAVRWWAGAAQQRGAAGPMRRGSTRLGVGPSGARASQRAGPPARRAIAASPCACSGDEWGRTGGQGVFNRDIRSMWEW